MNNSYASTIMEKYNVQNRTIRLIKKYINVLFDASMKSNYLVTELTRTTNFSFC